jgi:hypothetical protein
MAHAGWRGNGFAPEDWWKQSIFVRFHEDTTFAEVAKGFEPMSAISADSILLPDLEPSADASLPFASRFGSEEDLDALLREASARRMHVLLRIPLARTQGDRGAAEVRFWLNRGIVGFDLGTVASEEMDAVRTLRGTMDRSPGQRILVARTPSTGDVAFAVPRNPASRKASAPPRDPITLHLVSVQDVEAGSSASAGTALQAVEITLPGSSSAVAAAGAGALLPGAIPSLRNLLPLLLSSGAPVLDIGLLTSASARSAVQQVLTLRSTHEVLRSGMATVLPTGNAGMRAWLLRDRQRGVRGSLLLVDNRTEAPVTLHLAQAVAAQGLRGAYLRPLLRADGGMGAVNLESGTLPANAALLAEVRSDRYVAPATLDPDAPPPGSGRRRSRRR